jgi:hypothetical protein
MDGWMDARFFAPRKRSLACFLQSVGLGVAWGKLSLPGFTCMYLYEMETGLRLEFCAWDCDLRPPVELGL